MLVLLGSCGKKSAPPDYQAADTLMFQLWERGDTVGTHRLGLRMLEQVGAHPPATRGDSAAVGATLLRLGSLLYATQNYPGSASLYMTARPHLSAMPDSMRARWLLHIGVAAWRGERDNVACSALQASAYWAHVTPDSTISPHLTLWIEYIHRRDSVFARQCAPAVPPGPSGVPLMVVVALCMLWLMVGIVTQTTYLQRG